MNNATERSTPAEVAAMNPKNFTAIPDEYLEEMSVLSDAEYGRLIRAIQLYNRTGEPMELSGSERFFAIRCQRANDGYREYFNSQAEYLNRKTQVNRINGAKGGKASASKRKQSHAKSNKAKRRSSDAQANASDAQANASDAQANASDAPIYNYHIPDTYTTTDTQSITGTCRDEHVHSSKSLSQKIISGNKQNSFSFCSELPLTRATEQEPVPAGGLPGIVLNTGEFYFVTTDDVKNWESLYPAVDIAQEIRNMAGWCDANPKKRKTRAGIRRFINSWLSRAQNHGGGNSSSYAGGSNGGDDEFAEYFAQQDSITRAQLDAAGWDRFGGPGRVQGEAHTV